MKTSCTHHPSTLNPIQDFPWEVSGSNFIKTPIMQGAVPPDTTRAHKGNVEPTMTL